MGVLKIKTSENTWKTIDNLNLISLQVDESILKKVQVDELYLKKSDDSYDNVNTVIENAAVDVYIECSTNGGDPATVNAWFNTNYPAQNNDGTDNKARAKAIKGFLIEHRTIDNTTYHLPYYWNGSSWAPLNAIWG